MRVVFKTMDDLRDVLLKEPSSRAAGAWKTPTTEEMHGGAEQSDQWEDHVFDPPNEDAIDLVTLSTWTTVGSATRRGEIRFEKWVAGILFTRLYRRVARRWSAGKHRCSASEEIHQSFFRTCFDVSTKIEWPPRSTYKLLFLGLVPHLLTCLTALEAYSYEREADIKRQRVEEQDPDILTDEMAQVTYVVWQTAYSELFLISSLVAPGNWLYCSGRPQSSTSAATSTISSVSHRKS